MTINDHQCLHLQIKKNRLAAVAQWEALPCPFVAAKIHQKTGGLVKRFHYYEIVLNGEPSWIVVREMINGERQIYTIVDSLKK